jgi:hypothetical protein
MLTGNALIRTRLDELISNGERHWSEFEALGKKAIKDQVGVTQRERVGYRVLEKLPSAAKATFI